MQTVTALAKAFADTLKQWLSDEEFSEMIRLNKTADYAGNACASHDFCDANMAMDSAFVEVLGRSPISDDSGMSQSDCDIWNAAWRKARELYIGRYEGN